MKREEFIAGYCARSGIPWEMLSQSRVCLPCRCGEPGCEGWAMIPNDQDSIAWHRQQNEDEPLIGAKVGT